MTQPLVPVRARLLWGATLVTAGAQLKEAPVVEVPILVQGEPRAASINVMLHSGTVDELVNMFRQHLLTAFGAAISLQQSTQTAFLDVGAVALTDLTPALQPGDAVAVQKPAAVVEPVTPVPEAIPAAEVPPATTELVPPTPPAAS